jgi:ribonuclease T2
MNTQRATRLSWPCLTLAVLLLLNCAAPLARHHAHSQPATGTPGQFDYYVLTLSWSPSYCLSHQQDRAQCGGRGYGFVLHGLWPQYDAGNWLEFCGSNVTLPPEAVQIGNSLFPNPKLMEHEWQRHGTCSGLDAVSYFRTADKALAAVRVPTEFEAPHSSQSMTGAQIASAFRKANPAIPADGLIVACGRGELNEVRVCLTRDLAPRSCGQRARNSCPVAPVDVPAIRGQ